jgi:hypothetical protein
MQGGDTHVANMTVAEGVAYCMSQPVCRGFTARTGAANCTGPADVILELHFKDPWGATHVSPDKMWAGWYVDGPRPVAGTQLWAKPLGNGKTAALFINGVHSALLFLYFYSLG